MNDRPNDDNQSNPNRGTPVEPLTDKIKWFLRETPVGRWSVIGAGALGLSLIVGGCMTCDCGGDKDSKLGDFGKMGRYEDYMPKCKTAVMRGTTKFGVWDRDMNGYMKGSKPLPRADKRMEDILDDAKYDRCLVLAVMARTGFNTMARNGIADMPVSTSNWFSEEVDKGKYFRLDYPMQAKDGTPFTEKIRWKDSAEDWGFDPYLQADAARWIIDWGIKRYKSPRAALAVLYGGGPDIVDNALKKWGDEYIDRKGKIKKMNEFIFKRAVWPNLPGHIREKIDSAENEYFTFKNIREWPVDMRYANKPSSLHGWRKDPFTGKRKFHTHLDIAGKEGTPVISMGQGIVVDVPHRGYGPYNVTVMDINGNLMNYGHMCGVAKGLKIGTKVRAGQFLGCMGDEGRATGPHLAVGIAMNLDKSGRAYSIAYNTRDPLPYIMDAVPENKIKLAPHDGVLRIKSKS